MLKALSALSVPLLLLACGEADAPSPADDRSDTALAASFGGAMTPGLYKVVQSGQVENESTRCFTAEQIADGKYVKSGELGEDWSVDRNQLGGGIIDVAATGPADAKMIVSGTHDAQSFTVESVLTYGTGDAEQRMDNRLVGTFQSATCDAAE